MYASELIEELRSLISQYGDHKIYVNGENGLNDCKELYTAYIDFWRIPSNLSDSLESVQGPIFHIGEW